MIVKTPIVLIIDEAQHAITTDESARALFALKAAGDELNSTKHHGLRVVATGSNRDKLAMLRAGRDQAFYGAPLVSFPHLDASYVKWFCDNADLPKPSAQHNQRKKGKSAESTQEGQAGQPGQGKQHRKNLRSGISDAVFLMLSSAPANAKQH